MFDTFLLHLSPFLFPDHQQKLMPQNSSKTEGKGRRNSSRRATVLGINYGLGEDGMRSHHLSPPHLRQIKEDEDDERSQKVSN